MDLECPDWTLDPPPHDSDYFRDHLIAAHNYWAQVSDGKINIDTTLNSRIFPPDQNSAYLLPHDMLYYHPYLEDFDETEKLFELSRDALDLADPDVNFEKYSAVIIVHAGMGGDFAFTLDPTPGNIPSAYLSDTDFRKYGLLQTDEKVLNDLIILPESQNFQQYAETRALFADTDDPCFYQVGLNGTLALMLGFHFDLPPLYDSESGRSLVGKFALMDQGSNNFHGIVPAFPDPYTRIEAYWLTPVVKNIGDNVSLSIDDPPIRISISETEYYLIENRQRNLKHPDAMAQWIDAVAYDTVSVITGKSGVVVKVDEYSAGLPGNGLNIWHIDETARFTKDNPNGGPVQFVDFVEADGAQDMGQATRLLFADYLETGWWFDTWFAGNEGYFHLNRGQEIMGDSLLVFGPETFPSTRSNNGMDSHLRITDISKNGSTMSFTIGSDRVVRVDSVSSIIGWGSSATELWAFNRDSTRIIRCILDSGRFVPESTSPLNPDSVFQGAAEKSFTYRYPWLVPIRASGVDLFDIRSGYRVEMPGLDSLFELSNTSTGIRYFAKQGNGYVLVERDSLTGLTSLVTLDDRPLTGFYTSVGTQVFYGSQGDPLPAGVKRLNVADTDLKLIAWSSQNEAIQIADPVSGEEQIIVVDKPLHIIPLDTDDDGGFEIALFYPNAIRIINQAGVSWNGSPFSVDSYYGNPIIAPLLKGEPGIFLRHANHYTVHSFSGDLVDQGILPAAMHQNEQSLRIDNEHIFLLSSEELLYFDYEELEIDPFWADSQGNPAGDRITLLSGSPSPNSPVVRQGSAFNYPNPVKGNTTTIRIWLGDIDEWSIEIFSLNGAQVDYIELNVQQQHAYNEWQWDASAVSNGVYLAQIVAGNQSEMIKIAVIR